jgi:LysM repeat protein
VERFREVCVAYGLDSLWEKGSAWRLSRLRQLGDVGRSTLPVPGDSNARKALKLLPVWMLVNLALLLVVLLVMAAGTLPRSLAGKASLSSSCRWHTVTTGETLYAISASYHLTAATVAESNHLRSYGALHPGQRLCIPLAVPTLAAAAADELIAPNLIATGPAVQGPTQFIQFALPYAVSAHQQTGWPVSMILAQWALEHGWAVPTFTGYNWGNVGALPGEPTVASGGAPGAPALFAFAPTPQDGVNYYVAVAGLSYYSQVAPAASSGGPNAAAQALGASPWDAAHYTGDGNPGDSLITIMSDFNLYRYD